MKKAIDYLVEWTENLNWKNYLLNTILQNNEIDIETITSEITDIISNNRTIKLITSLSEESEQIKLFIKEIKNPININALCSEAGCELGRNLNVFYGENGTGKSSYVKVFRKLADNFYTTEKNLDIMPNIYTSAKSSDKQMITVCYSTDNSCDGEGSTQCIEISKRHPELSRINVFDSSSITPLLNTDLTFSVLPQGLNYFTKLTDLIDQLRVKFQEMIDDYKSEQNKIFIDSSFSIIASDISTIASNVSSISKLDSFLNTHYSLPEDIDSQIESFDNKIKELQSTNPIDLIKILSTQKTKLEAIKKSFDQLSVKVSADNINNVNGFIEQYNRLLSNEKKYNEEFNSNVKHIVSVNNDWVNFISSAKGYYKSIGVCIPEEKSACIFCGQILEKQQIDLIESCFQHINSEISQSKKETEKKIQSYIIPDIPVAFSNDDEQLFYENKRVFIEKLKTIISLIDKNKKVFKDSIENRKKIPEDCIINFEDIYIDINKEIGDIDGRLENLGKTNQEITELVEKISTDKNVLLRIKKVNESKELFSKWYESKAHIESLNSIKSRFSTNSLTTKSKDAFKEIVAGDYTSTFKEYCDYLGVPNVGISWSSKKGQSQRGKYIGREDIKVTEILSEGEQKAIALAEFATDLNIRKNYCTTLFDDPVTSFDYKRAEKIADLIFEISKARQVIVFTHNIMFYYYLYNCCAKENNKENRFFKIDEFDRDNKGLISISAEGRLENLNEITKKIKNHSQKINSKSCLGDELEQTLKSTYSDIRTWCELIVEEGFLKKIIRRYEPNIMFNPVTKITPEFVDYIPAVSELFDKSCRYMLGHSQPRETQNVKASREEFNKDYTFICELTDKYKS